MFFITGKIYPIKAEGSSQNNIKNYPLRAWLGKPGDVKKWFHSENEDNPWLKLQLNRATMITSVTVRNRKDCCPERLRNLEVRAGMRNDLTNPIVGTFKGPGEEGKRYVIRSRLAILAEFITFQLNMEKAILTINGIKLNEEPILEGVVLHHSFSCY